MGEGAGNRPNFFRGAAPPPHPGAAAGLCSRSRAGAAGSAPRPLPAGSGRLPLRPGPGGGWGAGRELPSRSPGEKGGSRAGLLPAPFCRAPPASPPRAGGSANRFSPAGERRQAGLAPAQSPGDTGPLGAARRAGSIAGQPGSSPSARAPPRPPPPLLQPLSSLRPRESRAKPRKRESFSKEGNNRAGRHKGAAVRPALPEGPRAAPGPAAGRPGGGPERGASVPLMLR